MEGNQDIPKFIKSENVNDALIQNALKFTLEGFAMYPNDNYSIAEYIRFKCGRFHGNGWNCIIYDANKSNPAYVYDTEYVIFEFRGLLIDVYRNL